MNRRQVLTSAGMTFSAVLGGCSAENSTGSTGSSSTSTDTEWSVQTPPRGECERSSQFRPKPNSPETKQYSKLPDSVTGSSARTFAIGYERAYQYNSKAGTHESIQVDVEVPEWAVSEARKGYIVGLTARVQFEDTKTPKGTTPYASGFFEFSVWYYVTNRFSLRGDRIDKIQKGDSPTFDDAAIVACSST